MESIQDALKGVMRSHPQAVSVLTATENGKSYGITVSSFTSVSLEPPLVLLSIARAARNHAIFVNAKEFAVNLLADDQRSVSDRFAGRTQLSEKFEGLRVYSDATGAPIIADTRAYIECRNWRIHEGGDHSLILAEVINAKKLSEKPPLVYYAQQYTTISFPEGPAPLEEILW